MKKILALVLAITTIFALAVPVFAAGTTIYLKGSGSSFNKSGWQNVFYLGGSEEHRDQNVWHLVYTGKETDKITEMQITFTNGKVFKWTQAKGFSTNAGGNNPGWVIAAPADWVISYVDKGNNNESGSFLVTTEDKNPQFNISGYHKGTPEKPKAGSLEVIYKATHVHKKVTTQPVRQKTIQPYKQKTYQPYKVPVFDKKISSINGTLVTSLAGVPGGKFGNYMTWLAVDTDEAKVKGITYQIADSSPNNKPIGYSYNIKIVGNELQFQLDERLISASVTVKLYSTIPTKHDPSGHRILTNGQTLIVPLPKIITNEKPVANATLNGNDVTIMVGTETEVFVNGFVKNGKVTFTVGDYEVLVEFNGNGIKSATVTKFPQEIPPYTPVIYMFVHFESLKWYTGEYEFVRWQEHGEPKLVSTKNAGEEVVKDELVREDVKTEEIIDGPYIKGVVLTVTGPDGYSYSGDLKELTGLKPGEYEITLTGEGFELSGTATVVAGAKTTKDLGAAKIMGPVQEVTLKPRYLTPIKLDPIYRDPIYLPAKPLCGKCNETDALHEHVVRPRN
jgi:hypothetical protein